MVKTSVVAVVAVVCLVAGGGLVTAFKAGQASHPPVVAAAQPGPAVPVRLNPDSPPLQPGDVVNPDGSIVYKSDPYGGNDGPTEEEMCEGEHDDSLEGAPERMAELMAEYGKAHGLPTSGAADVPAGLDYHIEYIGSGCMDVIFTNNSGGVIRADAFTAKVNLDPGLRIREVYFNGFGQGQAGRYPTLSPEKNRQTISDLTSTGITNARMLPGEGRSINFSFELTSQAPKEPDQPLQARLLVRGTNQTWVTAAGTADYWY